AILVRCVESGLRYRKGRIRRRQGPFRYLQVIIERPPMDLNFQIERRVLKDLEHEGEGRSDLKATKRVEIQFFIDRSRRLPSSCSKLAHRKLHRPEFLRRWCRVRGR